MTAVLAYDEDSVLTGSSDGLIRILSIQPNRMLGVLGEHSGRRCCCSLHDELSIQVYLRSSCMLGVLGKHGGECCICCCCCCCCCSLQMS